MMPVIRSDQQSVSYDGESHIFSLIITVIVYYILLFITVKGVKGIVSMPPFY